MEVRVMTGRTVEEAIEIALKELDADRDEAEVEILSRGKSGFLGIGGEPARVRVTKIALGEGGAAGAAAIASETVGRILQAAQVNVSRTVRAANDPETGGPIIDLEGEDSGLLIGRRGQTLQALQFLVTIIRPAIDPLGPRNMELSADAIETILRRYGIDPARPLLLPMSPADRRIVHTALTDHPGVITESSGMGDDRKVNIMPKPNQ